MRKIIGILLLLCGLTFACSPVFTSEFCQEIDFWNIQYSSYHYKYFDFSLNWTYKINGIFPYRFIILF